MSDTPDQNSNLATMAEIGQEVLDFKARCFPRLERGSAQDRDLTICFLAGMVDALFLLSKRRGSIDTFEAELMNAAQDLAKLANRGGVLGGN